MNVLNFLKMGVIDPENEGFYLLNVDVNFSFGQYMCPQLIPLTKKKLYCIPTYKGDNESYLELYLKPEPLLMGKRDKTEKLYREL